VNLLDLSIKGAIALPLALMVVGCGGDDDDSSSPPPPPSTDSAEGLWIGSTSTGRDIAGLLFNDGSYYVLYSGEFNPAIIAGVVQGSGTSNNGSFTSTNAVDFNLEGGEVFPATISASYIAKQSFNGTLTYPSLGNTVVTFTSAYDPAYEITPSLSTLNGTYTGQVALSQGIENATMTINPAGDVSGAGQSGCTFTGAATPRTDGNAFNISITFGGDPCFFANQTFSGIAYYDDADKGLVAAAPNASRTDGVLFVGVKGAI